MRNRMSAGLLLCLMLLTACSGVVYAQRPASLITATPAPPGARAVTATPLSTIQAPLLQDESAAPHPTLVLPTLTPFPDDTLFSIGQSVEGQPIWAWQFGDGPRTIVLVGGIHGGYEGNTVVLSEMLINHFRSTPEDVLPGIRLVIIPTANPDGLTRGDGLEGRFNANGVDLNRNWGCEWSETAYLRDISVDPGPRPFSEPESLALRFYFVAEPPDVAIFYHSALGSIFLGGCGDSEPGVNWLGDLLADTTSYVYQPSFDYYEVTGDATNWLAERGIPAAIIELSTREHPEFDRNLPGVMALQCYLVGDDLAASSGSPDPALLERCADALQTR
jgi:protein MpaA